MSLTINTHGNANVDVVAGMPMKCIIICYVPVVVQHQNQHWPSFSAEDTILAIIMQEKPTHEDCRQWRRGMWIIIKATSNDGHHWFILNIVAIDIIIIVHSHISANINSRHVYQIIIMRKSLEPSSCATALLPPSSFLETTLITLLVFDVGQFSARNNVSNRPYPTHCYELKLWHMVLVYEQQQQS